MRNQALAPQLRLPVVLIGLIALAGAPGPAAADQPQIAPTGTLAQAANEQIVEPRVDRRPLKLPQLPSTDVEFGGYIGSYSSEVFGANRVTGLRLGYHVTEDVFFVVEYGRTKVRDENFRLVLPGGVFAAPQERLTYANVSAGFNVLPGEVFIGSAVARPSGLYIIGGLGSTKLVGERHQTMNFGVGLRVFLKDWAALQVDMRDHIYALDVLGQRRSTQNLELTLGATFYFW